MKKQPENLDKTPGIGKKIRGQVLDVLKTTLVAVVKVLPAHKQIPNPEYLKKKFPPGKPIKSMAEGCHPAIDQKLKEKLASDQITRERASTEISKLPDYPKMIANECLAREDDPIAALKLALYLDEKRKEVIAFTSLLPRADRNKIRKLIEEYCLKPEFAFSLFRVDSQDNTN